MLAVKECSVGGSSVSADGPLRQDVTVKQNASPVRASMERMKGWEKM